MDKYEIQKQIGDGTYGTVARALHKKTGQLVAIKRMKQKYYSWDECIKLAEVQALRKLHAHPNIIKLKEVLRERNELFFVFEFMDGDLLGVIRAAKANPPLNPQAPMMPHTKVRAIMYQMFQSLAHLHKCGYFHRDLKPENMLIKKDPSNANGFDIVKLADFGLVKEIRAKPPFTDYVSTRWYRGPELLLQDRTYSSPVDMWAAGCIMVELMSTRPLFPGSNELDQLFRIISVFGPPTERTWPEGCAMARKLRYTFPNPAVTPLRKMVPSHTPPNAFDLIEKLLVYDPRKRLSAAQALQHPYFTVGGIGLDGPLAFQQPLETAGVLRPQNTSSAPPSQLSNAAANNTNGIASPLPPNNKPGSADRPIMPPVQISRPAPLPNNNNMNSNNNNNNNNFKSPSPAVNPLPSLNGTNAAGNGGGYGGQYHINNKPSPTFGGGNSGIGSLSGTMNNKPLGLGLAGGYSSPSPIPPPSGVNSHNGTLNPMIARPPTKIEGGGGPSSVVSGGIGGITSSSPLPSMHATHHNAPLPLNGNPRNSSLTGAPHQPPAQGSVPHRTSLAAGNDDLDDLLEEFSKGVERDSKPSGIGGGGIGGLSKLGNSGISKPTPPPPLAGGRGGGALPSLNMNSAHQHTVDESPLQKLLNSARYRNNNNNNNNNNDTDGNSAHNNVLHPTSTFANRQSSSSSQQQLSTPNDGGMGRRKVVPATTQLTSNVKPLLEKLTQLSPSSDPSWLQ